MKIKYAECNAAYSIPDEKFISASMRAACRKCGTKLVIDRDSGVVKEAVREL